MKELKPAAFRRVYFDVPCDVYDMMEQRARAANLTRKDYLAALVMKDAARAKKS